MKLSPDRRKTPSSLHQPLQQRLNAYSLAAGAAGASLLTLAQLARAEIVYTPANQTIGYRGSYNLDLNRDGIVDFVIMERARKGHLGSQSSFQSLWVDALPANRVNCGYPFCLSTFIYAAALRQGSIIGSGQQQHGWLPGVAQMADAQHRNGRTYYFDSWANATDRYLGLRFQINSETHFGWARLTVTFHPGPPKRRTWIARLTGYAYETVPGRSIQAGQTSAEENARDFTIPSSVVALGRLGPVSISARFATLGALALGFDGLPLWRREEPDPVGKLESN